MGELKYACQCDNSDIIARARYRTARNDDVFTFHGHCIAVAGASGTSSILCSAHGLCAIAWRTSGGLLVQVRVGVRVYYWRLTGTHFTREESASLVSLFTLMHSLRVGRG